VRKHARRPLIAVGGAIGALVGVIGASATALAGAVGPDQHGEPSFAVCRPTVVPVRRLASESSEVTSIGIAYFAGRSRGGDDAHLAAALTTELANQLLSARPKASAPINRKQGRLFVVKLSEGGGFADVDLSMTGSVFRDESSIRASVKLTRTSDGAVVWTGTKTRPLFDLPILARLIAQEVAVRVGAQLAAPAARSWAEKSPEIYELLLRGMYIPSRYDPDELSNAIDYFEQALKLDPSSKQARDLLESARLRLVAWGGNGTPLESRHLASGALRRIDDRTRDESERLVEEADAEIRDGLPGHACQLLNEAIDRDARSAPAYALRSLIRARGGEVRAAFADAETATQLGRPRWGAALRVVALRRTGDTTVARRESRKLLADARRRTGPLPFWDARFLANALAEMNDWASVESVLLRIDPRDPRLAWLREDPALRTPSQARPNPRRSR
jgi:TolB-like protein